MFGPEYKQQALGIYISSRKPVKIGAGQMINLCFKENSSPRKEKKNIYIKILSHTMTFRCSYLTMYFIALGFFFFSFMSSSPVKCNKQTQSGLMMNHLGETHGSQLGQMD